jgi:hypothetical protein
VGPAYNLISLYANKNYGSGNYIRIKVYLNIMDYEFLINSNTSFSYNSTQKEDETAAENFRCSELFPVAKYLHVTEVFLLHLQLPILQCSFFSVLGSIKYSRFWNTSLSIRT